MKAERGNVYAGHQEQPEGTVSQDLSDGYLDYYRTMLLIRRFEEKVADMFSEDLVSGTCHLCCGQEACAVGAVSALSMKDLVVSNHRGHGHLLARGGDPVRLMAELLGKAEGYCMGKGGTQHLCAMDIAFLGTNGITGGGIPIATGAALSSQYRDSGEVVACFFGEGASNQGTFHESLNMASIWQLPVVYFCENNLYGMSMHVSRSMAVDDVAIRSQAYSMPGTVVDGMDVLAVRDAMGNAVERARAGDGPSLVEAKTYRYDGHSKSDRRVYRTKEEEEDWRSRDPVVSWRARLVDMGASPDLLDEIDQEAARQVDAAARHAQEASFAEPAEATRGVYA